MDIQNLKAKTQNSIQQSEVGANEEWKKMAMKVIYDLCFEKKEFTANDFTERIRLSPVKTHDQRAIGAMIRKAASKNYKWIENTYKLATRYDPNANLGAHVAIWKSLLFGTKKL